ncbi:MAG TPA: family 43 glycosylhydrolase [Streptosporangiaceae bacterium]
MSGFSRKSRHLLIALLGVSLAITGVMASGSATAAISRADGTIVRTGAVRPADPIAHDPTIAKEGGFYYVVITGDAQNPNHYLPIKRSSDLVHWQEVGPVFTSLPSWVSQQLGTTPADAWAPSLTRVDGLWRLYYAASQFGTQNSVIGLATSPTLDPGSPSYKWTDRGMVIRSTQGVEDYNAIDPRYVDDGAGGAWLAFGSFWGGIKMRRLDPATGMLSSTDTTEYSLASRVAPDAEEGPAIIRHGGYFYLFMSFDFCCRGINSDYRMVVGRATSVTGPYLDAGGVPLTNGGGTEVLRGYNEFIGAGGGDVYTRGGRALLVNHYYDATDNGVPRLNVRPLSWRNGWPVVGDPLNPSRSVGHGDAYLRIVERTTGLPVTDVGCGYEGAPLALGANTPDDPCQQWQFGYRGGGDSSVLNRFSNKIGEVHACDNFDGGAVAQWGWIGFLGNNDCQRWVAAPTSAGWTKIQSILPGSRVWDVSRCVGGTATNIVVNTRTASCQEYRFEPVGPVLLIDQDTTSHLTGRQWRFTSVGGAEYTISPAGSDRVLAAVACDATSTPTLGVFERDRHATPCRQSAHWTLLPNNDGTWKLSLVGTSVVKNVKLELP